MPTADTFRTPPHLHQARFALPYRFSATQAPCPCLRSACYCPAPAHQRASGPRAASAGHCSRASRRDAAWRPCACEPGPAAAARGTAAPAGAALIGPPLAAPTGRGERRGAGGAPRGAGSKRGGRRAQPAEAVPGWSASTATSDLPQEGDRFYTPANHRLPCPSWPGSGGAWWLSSAGIPWQEPSQRGEMALWHW